MQSKCTGEDASLHIYNFDEEIYICYSTQVPSTVGSHILAMVPSFNDRNSSRKLNLPQKTQSLLIEIKRSLYRDSVGSEVIREIDSTLEAIQDFVKHSTRGG